MLCGMMANHSIYSQVACQQNNDLYQAIDPVYCGFNRRGLIGVVMNLLVNYLSKYAIQNLYVDGM